MVKIEGFELLAPQVVALPLTAGCTVRVSAGQLWLTQQGRPEDVWLAAGQRWTAPQDCRVWLSAEPSAEFQIARPAGQTRPAPVRGLRDGPGLPSPA